MKQALRPYDCLLSYIRSTKMRPSFWLYLLLNLYSGTTVVANLRNVTIDDQDSRISYFPPTAWQKITDNMDAGGTHMVVAWAGSCATLSFSFVSMYWVSTRWPYHVAVDVTIDGYTTNLDLQDYTHPVVPLGNRATIPSQVIYYFQGTEQKERTIRIDVPRGDIIAVVDMFIFEVNDSATVTVVSTVMSTGTDHNNNSSSNFAGGRLGPTTTPTSVTSSTSVIATSSSPMSPSASSTEKQINLPAIVGGIFGGLFAFALVFILMWVLVIKRKKKQLYPRPIYQTTPNYDVDLPGLEHHGSYTTPIDTQRTPLMAEIQPFPAVTAMANVAARNPNNSLYQDGGLGHSNTGTQQDGAARPPSRPMTYKDPFSDHHRLQQPPPPGRPVSNISSTYTLPQFQPGADPRPQYAQPYGTSRLEHAPPAYSHADGRPSAPPTPDWSLQPLKFVPIA